MRMRIFGLGVIVVVGFSLGTGAATPAGTAKVEAEKMWKAFLKADMATFATYNHPTVVRMNGGERKLIELLKRGFAEMKRQGIVFESVDIRPPSQVARAGKDLHAILPMQIVMKRPDARIRTKSYLIGVSPDAGKTWSFIDGAKITQQNVRKVLPSFSDALKLPSIGPPEQLD